MFLEILFEIFFILKSEKLSPHLAENAYNLEYYSHFKVFHGINN